MARQFRIVLKDPTRNVVGWDWVEEEPGDAGTFQEVLPAFSRDALAASLSVSNVPFLLPTHPEGLRPQLAPFPAHRCTFEYRRGWRRWLGWIAPEWVVLMCKCGKLRRIMKPGKC